MVVGCVRTGYVLRVELPVQRRLCTIFVRDVGSPDIHECFRGLTGSQRTPGIWGVTVFIEFFETKIVIGLSKNHCDLILTVGFDLSQNNRYLPIFYLYLPIFFQKF